MTILAVTKSLAGIEIIENLVETPPIEEKIHALTVRKGHKTKQTIEEIITRRAMRTPTARPAIEQVIKLSVEAKVVQLLQIVQSKSKM